ncbi:NAD(P)H-dependent glycerol-3-phosphate dehydrogenase [Seongchinamella sediminis]|uniref:Glycerol-3-phosphate dehydrogenase [NAD(P)+] n=1 Tax=Seongchinamella sediminis TaxID=2283635 RepID=A0A3L7E3E6_9GAMM|nr:NAD(P)H-dependent glycerol-3-phosphate dehydrogenase [Seongchinamella sediminis]RLQ22973.1 NAD(P)H-dependent glycerol-3-phosphate dehydrogenase [Seongchinamella sediminis]
MADAYTVAVLGGGSFGTVIGNIIACNGHRVRLWLRNRDRADEINQQHQNSDYLPRYTLDSKLTATCVLADAVAAVDIVFVAVPSKSFRAVVRELAQLLPGETLVISLTKGIEPGGFRLMSEILREELPGNPRGVLSGPNLATEIAAGQVAGSVIASASPAINSLIHDLLHSDAFLIYSSSDMFGVELGGALKNVYAILAGIGAALEFGENTVGMLLTRSLAEMSRFAVHLGANPMTFLGLSGVGDLFVTCSSPLSRNYRVGLALGRGQPLDDIVGTMDQVAEGINTLALLKSEADRRGIHMPLVNGLYAILYEHRPVADVFDDMMHKEEQQDVEFVTQ